jgi:hypothetical protein
MNAFVLVLLVVAVVLFVIEAVRGRSLLAAGLACWALAVALPGLAGLS